MAKKEKTTDQILRNRYTLALTIIACLVIFSQLAIQVSISKNEDDSRVINIAGRQRMLSQRITKCAYGIFISKNQIERADYLAELVKSTDLWEKSHNGLQHGNGEMGLPGKNSGKITELFKKIQDRHRIILNAARTIAFLALQGEPNSDLVRKEIRKITANEGDFLSGMDTIVFQYDSEAKAKIKLVKHIEIYLMLVTLLALVMEAAFIFRPAEKKIREKILQVRENEESIRRIFESAPVAMFLVDGSNLEILKLNELAAQLVKSDTRTAIGKDFSSLCGGYFRNNPELFERIRSCVPIRCLEADVTIAGRSESCVLISSNLIIYADKTAIIIGLSDVTEQKNLERHLQNSQKLEAVGKLAGGISHNINNILTAVIGYASLIGMKKESDTSVRHYADQILSLSEKAAGLTQGLLAFSRKQVMSPIATDLNGLIRNGQNLLLSLLGDNIEFELDLSPETLTVMADGVSLEQVLMNLASNAKDAMPDGGKLTVRSELCSMDDAFVRAHGIGKSVRFAVISVTDTGVGIDESTRERIFEPFFTTKKVGKGTGLGLASVYGIIEQHGGFTRVSSAPGRGTNFSVYMPLIVKTDHACDLSGSFPQGAGETVLLAAPTVLE